MFTLGALILSIALLLQLIAAFLAFRLIRVTEKRTAWILISIGIFFMAIRRCIPLFRLISGDTSYLPDIATEFVGLIISALMVTGAAWIAPLFLSIKKSEKALRESKEWLFTTLKSIGDAVIATNTKGYITFMNQTAQVLTGRKAEDSIGKPLKEIFIIIDEKTGQPKEDPVIKVIQNKNVVGLDNQSQLVTKNGIKIAIDDSAAPIMNEKGNIIGAVLIFRDITERRRAQQEIKYAHRELNQIFNTVADGMRVINRDFKVIRINERFLSLVNMSKDEVIGHKCYEVFPGPYCHTPGCSMKRILGGEDHLEYDVEKKRPDGNKITSIMTATPLRRPDGELIGIVEDFKDITERKRTEDLLRRANMVIENSPTVLFRWKAEKGWPVEFVSQNVTQFGYTPEELLSGAVPYTSIIYPKDLDRFTKEIERYSKLGKTHFQQEYHIMTKDGKILCLDTRTVAEYDSEGRITYYQGIIIDITERKQAEEALRQSKAAKEERQRLFSLLDVLPAIVYLQSSNYFIPFANRKFRELFGAPDGKHCYEILHGLKNPCEVCRMSHVLDKKDIQKWKLTTSDDRTYEMYDNLFTDVDGSLMVLELGIDITDRIRMEKARKEAEQKLEKQRAVAILSDRLRSLGEMATGMAHELNQPLLGVRGLAEHILIGLKRGWNISEETIKEKIKLIIEQTERMTHVIDHTRMFAKGADNDELLPVQINEVIKSGMGLIGAQLRFRGLILNYELADGLPVILANPFSLEEVIMNLINNARDAVMERIKKHSIDSPHIIIRTFKETKGLDSPLKIEVIDRGIGIPRELLSKVFEPFFTTKEPDKGTGLGLAISKSIIEGFKGTTTIQSTVSSGTTVTITLPVMTQN